MRGETNGPQMQSSSPPAAGSGASASPLRKAAISNVLNGLPHGKGERNGVSPMYTNGSQNGGSRTVQSTFYGHNREEVIRIMIQGLQDLGYAGTANKLSEESGYELETQYAAAFRIAILRGDWSEAEALLSSTSPYDEGGGVGIDGPAWNQGESIRPVNRYSTDSQRTLSGLALSEDANKGEMLFLIRQQKYLELLETRDLGAALMVLRQELQPLHQDERQLHALSSLIMCQSSDDLKYLAKWDGASGESRRHLLSELSRSISPSVMIPEHRLAELLTQVKESQVLNCSWHNSAEWPSLYTDHMCERDNFPITDPIHTLDRHRDEVWFLAFSNDGTKLATAGKDGKVIVYETKEFQILHILTEHRDAVAYVAWSPDDNRMVTCSQDKEARLWDTKNGSCVRVMKKHIEPVTTAAWAPDGQTFVTGSLGLVSPLCIWSLEPLSETIPLYDFGNSCSRVQDCAIAAAKRESSSLALPEDLSSSSSSSTDAGQQIRLVAICTDHSIHVYDYLRREKLSHISMDDEITCLNLSLDGHQMLMNLGCGEIWTVRVEDGEVVRKFAGQKQGRFVIRSCFGGASQGFVISGGEDSKITIWHRHTGRIVQQFAAHDAGCVNTVAWNAALSTMFASAGDDHKVRIFSTPRRPPSSRAPATVAPARQRPQERQLATSTSSSSSSAPQSSSPPRWGDDGGGDGDGDGGEAVRTGSRLRGLGAW